MSSGGVGDELTRAGTNVCDLGNESADNAACRVRPSRRSPSPTTPPSRSDLLAALLVMLAAAAFGLIRVQSANLPWHLATARLAFETGHWPATNTFSYTFPTYPAYQQYPVFQAAAWGAFRAGGWGALSLLASVGWIAALLLIVRWAGPFSDAIVLHPLWILALYALQRRMVLRPDLFTMLALGGELLALRAYARGRRWAIGAVPIVHLAWVNSHQLFPLSLVVQALFVGHLALVRRFPALRDDPGESPPPWAPAAGALVASTLLSFTTPLGWRIVEAPWRTATSLSVFRETVAEFHRIWTLPLELGLAIMTGLPAAFALWRTRRRPHPFDIGLWLMSLALVLAAVRGLMF